MKIWRIWNKGSWSEFHIDVKAKDVENAIHAFGLICEKRNSMATHHEITRIELIGEISNDK